MEASCSSSSVFNSFQIYYDKASSQIIFRINSCCTAQYKTYFFYQRLQSPLHTFPFIIKCQLINVYSFTMNHAQYQQIYFAHHYHILQVFYKQVRQTLTQQRQLILYPPTNGTQSLYRSHTAYFILRENPRDFPSARKCDRLKRLQVEYR